MSASSWLVRALTLTPFGILEPRNCFGAPITPGVLLTEAVLQAAACYMALKARAAGTKPGEGVPLIAKISDLRFRNPVYPGDTVLLEVKQKDVMGGFTMLAGNIKKADGTRVLNVEFSVAWTTPQPAKG